MPRLTITVHDGRSNGDDGGGGGGRDVPELRVPERASQPITSATREEKDAAKSRVHIEAGGTRVHIEAGGKVSGVKRLSDPGLVSEI